MEKSFFTKVILSGVCLPLIAGCIVGRRPRPVVACAAVSSRAVRRSCGGTAAVRAATGADRDCAGISGAGLRLGQRLATDRRDGNWICVSGRWMTAPRPYASYLDCYH